MEELSRQELPEGFTYEWAGQAFEEKQAGGTSAVIFVFALVMVFLILAAQYEKWTLPLAVVLCRRLLQFSPADFGFAELAASFEQQQLAEFGAKGVVPSNPKTVHCLLQLALGRLGANIKLKAARKAVRDRRVK